MIAERAIPIAPPRDASWLAELYQLACDGGFVPRCRCLRAGQQHGLRAQRVDSALLVLPLQGAQTVRDTTDTVVARPGETLLIARPGVVDTETSPDTATGRFEAVVIAIFKETIDNARRLVPGLIQSGGRGITTLSNERVAASLTHWVAAMRTQRISLACHALVGLVLQLHE